MKQIWQVDLTGKRVLISGGSSGIGSAVAKGCYEAGAHVIIADIKAPGSAIAGVQYHTCDVTSGAAIDGLFQELLPEGLPNILICCAGQGISEKLTDGDPEKWQRILNLNIMGNLRLIRAFVPAMLEAKQGDVVIISSVAAGQSFLYGGIYAASKAALQTIADNLRLEVLPHVRVTTIAPGVTDTAFFQNTISGFQSAEDIGYGSLQPEDVADAVLYAVSRPHQIAVNHLTVRPRKQVF